jgi:hypothetical protein
MKYINKLNIDFDQWDKINDYLFDEEYVLSKLNDEDKNKYFLLKKFLLKNNIFNKFFKNIFKSSIKTTWYLKSIKDKQDNINEIKVIYFIKYTHLLNLIFNSFGWGLTSDGFRYWVNINDNWQNFIN